MKELDSTDFMIILDENEQSPIQIWTDFVPEIDIDCLGSIQAFKDTDDLCLEINYIENNKKIKATRIFRNIDNNAWPLIKSNGAELVLCDSSGIVSKRKFALD